jgi:hypothetical protein
VAQRRGDARQDARRADVGVLVEGLADRQPQAPQGDMVGNVGMAGRAKQDRIVFGDLLASVDRHHAAVLLVVIAAPVEMVDLEGKAALALRDGFEHLDTGRHDFRADAVAGNGCDLVALHHDLRINWFL